MLSSALTFLASQLWSNLKSCKESSWQIWASTGFKPMTSAIPVRCLKPQNFFWALFVTASAASQLWGSLSLLLFIRSSYVWFISCAYHLTNFFVVASWPIMPLLTSQPLFISWEGCTKHHEKQITADIQANNKYNLFWRKVKLEPSALFSFPRPSGHSYLQLIKYSSPKLSLQFYENAKSESYRCFWEDAGAGIMNNYDIRNRL